MESDPMIKPEEIYMFIGFICTVVTLYGMFYSRTTKQENRITRLELTVERNVDTLLQHQKRLDSHDAENRVMLALVEKVDGLKEDIAEIKQALKNK